MRDPVAVVVASSRNLGKAFSRTLYVAVAEVAIANADGDGDATDKSAPSLIERN